ncbi:MAG: nitrite/sulfite reductase [Chloroflexi bacterium]|nr:nitrite/sulfite reductase [Chloroflexota bacterium]
MTTVERDQTIEEKLKYDYSNAIIPFLPEEVDDFETEATRFKRGEVPVETFTPYRLIRGVYGQRQPDVHMVRVKIPLGSLTADALDALGVVAKEFVALQKGHVTTRENIQFHFVPLDLAADVMRILGPVGLTSREACGNTMRNVTGCPEAGVAQDEPFYVSPYAAAYVRWFVRHPLTTSLPRKFKTAFASCARDCVATAIHDLGFIPQIVTDEKGVARKGFRMVTGGGTAIMPRIAMTLFDFVPVEEYLKVSEAVVRIFHRCDELRKNRARARLKFYVDRIGIDAFRQEVEEELKKPWARKSFDPTPLSAIPDEEQDVPPLPIPSENSHHSDPEFQAWLGTNVRAQKQPGYNVVWVKLPLGDIRANQFPVLARIARTYAGGRACITNEQNLAFRWVPDGYLHDAWQELKQVSLGEPGAHQITDVVACPGTDSCKLGITSSMGVASAIRETLAEMGIQDPLVKALHVKVSGCPNGCGQHHIANIGFHGAASKGDGRNQVPSYEVFLAGHYGDGAMAGIGKRLKAKVPAKRVPRLVREFIGHYQAHRQEDEPFNAFVERVGLQPFEEIASRHSPPGPLTRENIATYIDWGKTVLYKVERGEGECAV